MTTWQQLADSRKEGQVWAAAFYPSTFNYLTRRDDQTVHTIGYYTDLFQAKAEIEKHLRQNAHSLWRMWEADAVIISGYAVICLVNIEKAINTTTFEGVPPFANEQIPEDESEEEESEEDDEKE